MQCSAGPVSPTFLRTTMIQACSAWRIPRETKDQEIRRLPLLDGYRSTSQLPQASRAREKKRPADCVAQRSPDCDDLGLGPRPLKSRPGPRPKLSSPAKAGTQTFENTEGAELVGMRSSRRRAT